MIAGAFLHLQCLSHFGGYLPVLDSGRSTEATRGTILRLSHVLKSKCRNGLTGGALATRFMVFHIPKDKTTNVLKQALSY